MKAQNKANQEIEENEDGILYKTKKDSNNKFQFSPGLPHEGLMQELLNNKDIVTASPHITQKVLNMEWKWFERRIIKCLGDNEYSRKLQQSIRNHIKNEKKWIHRGARMEDVKNFQG